MNTAFSHALRLLVCTDCGAALHASVEGDKATCSVCETDHEVEARRENDGFEASELTEEERLEDLRRQMPRGPRFPDLLRELVDDDFGLRPDKAERAMADWQAMRQELASQSSFATEDRFYYLTRLLYDHLAGRGDDQQLRAILETALETSPSPHYRQVFRCILAREAARAGDPTAAEDWLHPCEKKSTHIMAHSAYVFSVAYVAAHNRQHDRILEVLGNEASATPVTVEHDAICTVLRANAHEKLGSLEKAALELAAGMRRVEGGVSAIERTLRATDELMLCRACFVRARVQVGDVPETVGRAGSAASRRRRRILAAAPWLLLSTTCLILAVATDPSSTTHSGHRIDVFFLVMGTLFSIPLFLVAMRKTKRNKKKS